MARVAEAVGDGFAALNLRGRTSDLESGNRGIAGVQLEEPTDHERAWQRSGYSQQSRQSHSAPFQEAVLSPPGAGAGPGQQRHNRDQPHQADDIRHAISSPVLLNLINHAGSAVAPR